MQHRHVVRIVLPTFILLSASIGASARPPVPAATTTRPAPTSSIAMLQTITVTGVVPGPALWKVSNGSHTLWILGVVPILPSGIKWRSRRVGQIIDGSQVVIQAPASHPRPAHPGLAYAAIKLHLIPHTYLPHGETLANVLPPPLYARWQVQKQRYYGDNHTIDRLRPLVAVALVLHKALKANGLRGNALINKTIATHATWHGVKVMDPNPYYFITRSVSADKDFATRHPTVIACLKHDLGLLERRIPIARTRANAWAVGNIPALLKLAAGVPRNTCNLASQKNMTHQKHIMTPRVRWLGYAEIALTSDTQSFAALPMHDLLGPHGDLAIFRARGYTITAPPGATTSEPASASSVAPAASTTAPPAPATSTH